MINGLHIFQDKKILLQSHFMYNLQLWQI